MSHFVAKVLREGVYEPDSPEPERRARPPLRGDHSKIHVIHGGIDTGRFRPFEAAAQRREWGLEPEHFAFGVVGGYDLPRGKGQREFLRAAAQVQAQIPQARFLDYWPRQPQGGSGADIAQLGLSGKAWLTPYCRGHAGGDERAGLPGPSANRHRGLSGVVLEAFACGKPVIASALDGIPEAFCGWKARVAWSAPGSAGELARSARPLGRTALAEPGRVRPTARPDSAALFIERQRAPCYGIVRAIND